MNLPGADVYCEVLETHPENEDLKGPGSQYILFLLSCIENKTASTHRTESVRAVTQKLKSCSTFVLRSLHSAQALLGFPQYTILSNVRSKNGLR